MSRYTIRQGHESKEVVVGWDPPLGTFFAQVFGPDTDEGEEVVLGWCGYMPREVETVEQLATWLAARNVTLPDNVAEFLAHDAGQPWEPGPLQRSLGFTGKSPE